VTWPAKPLPKLLEAADDPDPDVREQAIGDLGKTRSPATVTKLIEALRDQSVHVARRAASVLGNLRELPAVPELIECLLDDGLAETASWALLDIGTKRARIEVRGMEATH
jgi:HEAT repeat protein